MNPTTPPSPTATRAPAGAAKKVRVVVADDSFLLVKRLTQWLEAEGDMEVVGTASDGVAAVQAVQDLRPSLIVLDVRMPKLDGLGALLQIMRTCPTPVVLFCEKPETEAREKKLYDKAMELGALEVIYKPDNSEMTEEGGETGSALRQRVRMLAKIKVVRLIGSSQTLEGVLTPPPGSLLRMRQGLEQDNSLDVVARTPRTNGERTNGERTSTTSPPTRPSTPIVRPRANGGATASTSTSRAERLAASNAASSSDSTSRVDLQEIEDRAKERRIVVIGSSTGGPDAVRVVLSRFPPNFPFPIIIAQHMPRGFTHDFAVSLARTCALPVSEATERDVVEGGHVYVAPGGHNLFLHGLGFRILPATKGLQENCPSIDEMFRSAATRYKEGTVGVVLTGMGDDGCRGVKSIKAVGGVTIAQDEGTSDIFGMPKMAIATGCVDVVAPIQDIAQWIVHYTLSPSRTTIVAP